MMASPAITRIALTRKGPTSDHTAPAADFAAEPARAWGIPKRSKAFGLIAAAPSAPDELEPPGAVPVVAVEPPVVTPAAESHPWTVSAEGWAGRPALTHWSHKRSCCQGCQSVPPPERATASAALLAGCSI